MLIKYEEHRFRAASLAIIEQANGIIAEYQAEGMAMTLRQVYYQFIARDWFPESWVDKVYNQKHGLEPDTKNTIKNYDKLQELLSHARLAGLVSWQALEDRTRFLRDLGHWDSPEDILASTAQEYREDLWATQKYRIEVWIEKDALVGVIQQVCEELRLPYFSCRGYTSQSEQWRAGMRLKRYIRTGYKPVVLHFGDHDPSGIDMTRDNRQRLEMFCGGDVDFRRMALNMSQVEQYDPPPNPAKLTDSRANGYIEQFGDDCWELDALEPRTFRELIRGEVAGLRDDKKWRAAVKHETTEREMLTAISDRYPDIRTRIQDDTL